MGLNLNSFGLKVLEGHKDAGIEVHVKFAGAAGGMERKDQGHVHNVAGAHAKDGAI